MTLLLPETLRLARLSLAWPITMVEGILSLLAAVIAVLMCALLLRWIWYIRWPKQTVVQYIHLRNSGNVETPVRMSFVSPDGKLRFRCAMDGSSLPVKVTPGLPVKTWLPGEPVWLPVKEAPAQEQASRSSMQQAAGVQNAPAKGAPAKGLRQSGSSVYNKLKGMLARSTGLVNVVSDILSTIASLIPGRAGDPILRLAQRMQGSANRARMVTYQPEMKLREAQNLREQTSGLSQSVGGKQQQASSSSRQAPPVSEQAASAPVAATQAKSAPADGVPDRVSQQTRANTASVLLPALAPEMSVALELRLAARRPFAQGNYTFWLLASNQEGQEQDDHMPQHTVRSISVSRPSAWYWGLTLLLSAAVVGLITAWWLLLVQWFIRVF